MADSSSLLSLQETYALLRQGLSFARSGDTVAAVSLKDRGLAAHPDDPYVLHYAGAIESMTGRLPEAAALFSRAVRIRGSLHYSEMGLGDVHWRMGDKQAALHWFERACASDPASLFAYLRAAQAERELGNAARALPLLEKARGLDPANAAVTAELAAVLLELGRYADLHSLLAALAPESDAFTALAAAVVLTAEPSAEQLGVLADLRARQGRLEQALSAAEKAVLLAPSVPGYAEQRDTLREQLRLAGNVQGGAAAPPWLIEKSPITTAAPTSNGFRAEIRFENLTAISVINNKDDIIQSHHVRGAFYEIEQLCFHRNTIYSNSTVLDIGTNIGNHTLFYANFTKARRVYCFEPNPTAREILMENLRVNRLDGRVDTSYAEFAIGSEDTIAFVMDEPDNNLGATTVSLVSAEPETARRAVCRRLDSLTFEGPISFLKIDVEGWELMALAGAADLIRTHKPAIAIEIIERNESNFWSWVKQNRYHVINMFQDTQGVRNYIMVAES